MTKRSNFVCRFCVREKVMCGAKKPAGQPGYIHRVSTDLGVYHGTSVRGSSYTVLHDNRYFLLLRIRLLFFYLQVIILLVILYCTVLCTCIEFYEDRMHLFFLQNYINFHFPPPPLLIYSRRHHIIINEINHSFYYTWNCH